MDRKKRLHNILEEALKTSGIKQNEEVNIPTKKAKPLKPKKIICKKTKLIESNKAVTKFSTSASRRLITEDEENYNPEEFFPGGNESLSYYNEIDQSHLTDDAIPGPSDISKILLGHLNLPMVYNDTVTGPPQINETLSGDLPTVSDIATGSSVINETVSGHLDLPLVGDTVPVPSETDEIVSGHLDVPVIANAAPDASRFHVKLSVDATPGPSEIEETVSRYSNVPVVPDEAPEPSELDEIVSKHSDLPLIDSAPGPPELEETVPGHLDVAIVDYSAPGPSEIVEPVSADQLDVPVVDEAVPGPSQSTRNVAELQVLHLIDDTTPSASSRKKRCKTSIQYVDYMSDEDFSTIFGCDDVDSDEWVGSDVSNSSEEQKQSKKKKTQKSKKTKEKLERKNKKINNVTEENVNTDEDNVGDRGLKRKKKNTRKERSILRQSGKMYTRTDGKVVLQKSVQPNPCKGKKCGHNCENISDERRQLIFNHFWNLSSERRRDWLVGMTEKESVKRKRTDSEKRSNTFKYCITEGEGKRVVCLQFLAATLDISQKCIYYQVSNANSGSSRGDLRGRCEPSNKTKTATKDTVVNFIKSLPAVPSHYCRQDSNRVYLPQEYKNISSLYNNYKKRFFTVGMDIVSERMFRKIFTEEFNIAFHVPKKDKCLKCIQLQQVDINDPKKAKEKADHEIEKEESHNRFSTHKLIHKTDPSTLCTSFDLEKVLNTPHGESMLLYYSRKIAVYNLCFYENGTRRVFCYYWDESNGKRGANEISSILHNYIKSVDERGNIKNLLLYCDCCPGQNKNRTVLAMIHFTLQDCKNIQTIQINYLLTGHTYMPVDSVHAVIETNLKNTIIYAPSQWYTVFTTARKQPFPYEVERMTFESFLRWDVISEKYFKGNLTGKISKVRVVTFKKNKPLTISIKESMNVAAKSYEVEVQSKTNKGPLMSCYRSPLPIPKAKYDDLMKLCKEKVIPAQFHQEYSSIPKANNIRDSLPESDLEDYEVQLVK